MAEFDQDRFLDNLEKRLQVHSAFIDDSAAIADVTGICRTAFEVSGIVEKLDCFAVNCSTLFRNDESENSLDDLSPMLKDRYMGAIFAFISTVADMVITDKLEFSQHEKQNFDKRFLAAMGYLNIPSS